MKGVSVKMIEKVENTQVNENINDFTTINTIEQAIQVANELERLETVVEHYKTQLKKFVEANGPVETATKVYYIQETLTYKFTSENLKKVAEALVLEGKNPWDYLSITASNLKKAGWNENIIQQYGNKNIYKSFKSKKR